ncbi:hypothetical protein ACVDG5_002590 [Mesorhizobium sp. ORM6]
MHASSETPWPSANVSVPRRHHGAGAIVLPPVSDHRIVVHASPQTWSFCMITGTRHLRRQGDIDLVPAGEEGGYAAETACEALEIRLAPQILQQAAFQMGSDRRSGLDMRHIMKNERIVHLALALESERRAGAPSGPLYADRDRCRAGHPACRPDETASETPRRSFAGADGAPP